MENDRVSFRTRNVVSRQDDASELTNGNTLQGIEPREMPARLCCLVVTSVLFTTCVLMPVLAVLVVPVQDRVYPWWQTDMVYQIYPMSFQDSNGDGVGDIKGITSRLEYLEYLGAKAVWLNPIYPSPMVDFGYDVSDYTAINPLFGSMHDLEYLINQLHKKDMKLILDFIPNHSSDKHKWFQESRKGGLNNPYRDFYIWHDGIMLENGTMAPPNNWISRFGGSAWTFDELRDQFYLHQYSTQQPDLNYRNPDVIKQMDSVLEFWMEKGVDGFRFDAVDALFEVEDLRDVPEGEKSDPLLFLAGTSTRYQQDTYIRHQPETFSQIIHWRDILDKYTEKTGRPIYMALEISSWRDETTWRRYRDLGVAEAVHYLGIAKAYRKDCGGECFRRLVDVVVGNCSDVAKSSWVSGNHDHVRVASRKGDKFVTVSNMLILLLPGAPTTYYGEELGLTNSVIAPEQKKDTKGFGNPKKSRDGCRGPMVWDGMPHGGFSTAEKTWLPVTQDYAKLNVQSQRQNAQSSLSAYRQLLQLTREQAFVWGWMKYVVVNENIFSFVRHPKGWSLKKYLIAVNIGNSPSTDNYHTAQAIVKVKPQGTVVFNTMNFGAKKKHVAIGKKVDLESLTLKPGQGLVIQL